MFAPRQNGLLYCDNIKPLLTFYKVLLFATLTLLVHIILTNSHWWAVQDALVKETITHPHGSINNQSSYNESAQLHDNVVEKYIAYYAHSGLHNQRVALENAIVLAYLTNRTLLLPPAILGKKVSWAPSPKLGKQMSEIDQPNVKKVVCSGRHHCTAGAHLLYPWDDIMDFSFVKKHIRYVVRPDFKPTTLKRILPSDDVYNVPEPTRYYHRIFESFVANGNGKYSKALLIDELKRLPHKAVHFNSLFGTSRIVLSSAESRRFREDLFASLIVRNPAVVNASNAIVAALGGQDAFVSAHMRGGDGKFRNQRRYLAVNFREALAAHDPDLAYSKDDPKVELAQLDRGRYCRRTRKSIYIATDIPATDSLFEMFHDAFPCVFTLADFPKDVHQFNEQLFELLDRMQQPKALAKLFIPLLDLHVAIQSRRFYGTHGSTFSGYVQRLHRLRGHETILVNRRKRVESAALPKVKDTEI